MNTNKVLCNSLFSRLTGVFLLVSFLISPMSVAFAQTTSSQIDTSSVSTDSSATQDTTAVTPTPTDTTSISPDATAQIQSDVTPDTTIDDPAQIKDDTSKNPKDKSNTMSMMSLLGPSGNPLSSGNTDETKHLIPHIDETTGALIYRYDLDVPPGRNNLTPDLGLIYNSQDTNSQSPFGYGWSTSIPFITRVNKHGSETLYTSTYPTFTSSLSGELVQLTQTNPSTAPEEGTYAAKVENGDFTKYSYASSIWTVTDKTGQVYTFGGTSGGRQDDSGATSHIYKWMLTEQRDTNNNYISYSYYKNAGQIYPDTVKYTGNGSTDGIFEVDFLRQSRSDIIDSREAGFSNAPAYEIYEIDVKVSGSWIKKYTLAYGSNSNGAQGLLTSITKAGRDVALSTTTTLPAETFDYNQTSSARTWTHSTSISIPVDTNGGGTFHINLNGQGSTVTPMDINGDGLIDFVQAYRTSTTTEDQSIYLNNGNGWTLSTAWAMPIDAADSGTLHVALNGNSGAGITAIPMDVNGDGLPDLVQAYRYGGTSEYQHIYINNGTSGWTLSSTWAMPIDAADSGTLHVGLSSVASGSGYPAVLVDINGDGLPDLVQANRYSGGEAQNIYLNTGSGWTLSTAWAMPIDAADAGTLHLGLNGPGSGTGYPGVLVDINGDGLPDLVQSYYNSGSEVQHIYINNGHNGWDLSSAWAMPVDAYSPTFHIAITGNAIFGIFMDVNGDNLPDIVQAYRSGGTSEVQNIYINNGVTGWTLSTAWAMPIDLADSGTLHVGLVPGISGGGYTAIPLDVNGDGLPDIAQMFRGTSTEVENVYLNPGKISLLSKITLPSGGTTDVVYTQLSASGSSNKIPRQIMVVSGVTTTDPVNSLAGTTSYTYNGGVYYYNTAFDRKVAGFNTVIKTDPAGNVTKTFYHQGNGTDSSNGEYSDQASKIGEIYRIEQYDGSSNLYKVTVNKCDDYNIGTNHDFVKLTRTTTLTYDGTGSHKDTTQEYGYDNTYGNLTSKTDWGQVTGSTDGSFTDTGSDKSVESISYVANTSNYVVGLPYDDSTVDQSSVKVNQTRTYYDGNSLGTTGNGNPTKVEKWVTSSTYVNTQKSYDGTYGIVATSTDPDSNVTTYTADSAHLYPATVTDALSHATSYTYDYSSGKVIQTTEPNGFVYQTNYDGLNRIIEQKIPGATTPFTPVTKTTYTYTDTSGAVSVHQVDSLDGSITVDTYTYFDGLNRPIQKRKEAESNYNVSDYVYNNLGLLYKESLPYNASGASKTSASSSTSIYATYTYDPLQRVASVANAVGTTSYVYNLWKTSVTDPRSKVKDYYNDARGNLIQVDEHNSGSTYTTTYTYNLNGKLLSITDALSNSRAFTYDGLGNRLTAEDLHASGDTSFGSWSYTYDNAGNMTQSVSPEAKTTNYTYDAVNRKLTENYTGVSGTEITYAYDSCTNGVTKLCSVTMTSGANTAYTYDSNGNTASEAKTINSTTYTTSYTYDRQNNVLTITYPDSAQVRYTFNTAGLLDKVERKESGGSFSDVVSNIDYSPSEKPSLISYVNGLYTINTYDTAHLYRLMSKMTSIYNNLPPFNNNPVITLTGAALINKTVGDTWTDPGYVASDAEDGTLTSSVTVTGSVNTATAGTYQLVYDVVDSQGAPAARMIRTVVVKAATSHTVKALVVGGGAGGGGGNGSYVGGGGGAGAVVYDATHTITSGSYSITVGSGGAGYSGSVGDNGNNSVFDSITAGGGGGGGRFNTAPGDGSNNSSAGGGGGYTSGQGGGAGNGTGHNGGNSAGSSSGYGGGGGGSSANGANGTYSGGSGGGGNGGAGTSNSISGSSVTYGGGGGGGVSNSTGNPAGTGGSGGGGNGGQTAAGSNGTANTGGGGGGGTTGGNGGSGVVVVSYVTADYSTWTITGGTSTTSGSNTIRTFTSSATLSVTAPTNNNPVITLTGANLINLNVGDTWSDPGYSATDTEDGTLTGSVTTTGSVNTSTAGTYQLVYDVVDSGSLPAARKIRTVVVHSGSTPQNIDYKQNFEYTYDANGNITKIIDSSNTSASKVVDYVYDDLNRMASATATGVASGQSTYTHTYAYNAIGDITSGPVGTYSYSGSSGSNWANPHAATSVNSVTNTYDKDGNNTADGTLTNTWNYKDQLTQTVNGGTTLTSLYDQNGDRVSFGDGTTTTAYANKYYNYNGTKKTKQIYAGDTLIATVETVSSTVTPYYVHVDHLGSASETTDGSGALIETLDYFPYGSQRISSGSYTEQRQYVGQIYDSQSGLDYLNARYYNGAQGRFISEDPQFWNFDQNWLQDPQNQNSYSYARDNPVTMKDPDGNMAVMAALQFLFNSLFGKSNLNNQVQIQNNSTINTSSPRTTTWDPVTDQRIKQLDPSVQQPATNFINNTESQLYTQLRVTQGYRSTEEQNKLYNQGRTTPGNIVTNAQGGESYHNYGLALDVVVMDKGKPNWNQQITPQIANVASKEGFAWGGNWTSLKDYPHFQMTFGQSIKDLKRNKK